MKSELTYLGSTKPRIRLEFRWGEKQEWVCFGGGRYRGYGPTPRAAYYMWFEDLIPF